MTDTEMIRREDDGDGVVKLVLDDPDQAVNTLNESYVASMDRVLKQLEDEREEIAGVVVTSGKKTFAAGGDLDELRSVRPEDSVAFAEHVRQIKAQLRRLETLGRPVVAAVNGTALGGGLELSLAAHHRIALSGAKTRIGLPEVTLGLLPGAGGVVRTVRMLGIEPALRELLLEGKRLTVDRALELGLIDRTVDSPEAMMDAARKWIKENPEASQPWDRDGYRIPGGAPGEPAIDRILPGLPAGLIKQLRGAPYPAPRAILAAAVEGAQVDFDGAIEIEGRYFVKLATGQIAKNMIQGLFFDMQRVGGDRVAVDRSEVPDPTRVAVLGAGMMGAGIAYDCARSGLEAVLLDRDLATAERGKSYSERLVQKAVERGRSSAESGRELLERIRPTADPKELEGCDLMIEAVFEDPEVKAETYSRVEPQLTGNALLGSNTSTLPITDLAKGVSRPADFIGLHFFSPVEKMPLLEIIVGRETSKVSVARALRVAKILGKTPIIVNDSRGFFTSRVIQKFIDEGISMLGDGIPAASIEQASAQAGYPAPVLQLSDELNLNLMRRIREAARAETEAEGSIWTPGPADRIVDRMLDEFDRGGKLGGAGFYEYEESRRKQLWPGLTEAFPSRPAGDLPPLRELSERMLFIESLEAVRCLSEGVVETVADANVGSILGIGFPRWTGGVLQYINGYEGGPTGFVERARELASRYGTRFDPPTQLVELADGGGTYSDEDGSIG